MNINIVETELLEHALVGLQLRRQELDTRIEGLQRRLKTAVIETPEAPQPKKRRLSPAGRAAIVAAAKRRWRLAKKAGRRTLG